MAQELILFTGLNDWIIRNLIKSNFRQAADAAGMKLTGLIYEQSYPVFKDIVASDLGMTTYPMELKKWSDYDDTVKDALKYLERGTLTKRAKAKSKTYRLWQKARKPASALHRLKVDLKFRAGTGLAAMRYDKRAHARFIEVVSKSAYVQDVCIPFLKKHNPACIVSCSPETSFDIPWLIAAKSLGIKSAIWVRSWDNITSKISLVPHVDAAIVWSELMESEFKMYYPEYDKIKIYKVGSLQFDEHRNPANLLPYKEFCNIVGLDPERPFVAYTTGGPHICEGEHLLVNQLVEHINKLDIHPKPQVLVRIHPYAWSTNLKIDFNHDNIVTWPPKDKIGEMRGGVTASLLNDHKIMLSTFYYQKVNINIASTVTIDSCIYDKPVINIAFDPVHVKHKAASIARYYHYDHYAPLVKAGGVRVVYNIQEFEKAFKGYWEHPEQDKIGRERIVELECGTADGNAGRRLANALTEIMSK